jgi:hypothetical protein
MAKKKPPPPWLTPGTPSTWVCQCGAVNPRKSTTYRKGHR